MVYIQYLHELEIKFLTFFGWDLNPGTQDSGITILGTRVQIPSKLET